MDSKEERIRQLEKEREQLVNVLRALREHKLLPGHLRLSFRPPREGVAEISVYPAQVLDSHLARERFEKEDGG